MVEKKIDNIHQIFISDSKITQRSISGISKSNMISFINTYKEANYFLWDNEKIISLIEKNFSPEVINSYKKLHAYTAKADLARYCILYIYGGIYSDFSNKFFRKISIKKSINLFIFRDSEPYGTACWAATSTIFFSEPRQIELKIAIEMIVRNTNNRYYGTNSLCPTGPIMLGRALAFVNRNLYYGCGTMVAVSAKYKNRNHVFLDEEGNLIALRTQGSGGKPKSIGLKGTNDYNKIWNRRNYYNEKAIHRLRYLNIFSKKKSNSSIKLFNFIEKSIIKNNFSENSYKDHKFYVYINGDNVPPPNNFCIYTEHDIFDIIYNNFSSEILDIFTKTNSYELKKYIGCLCILFVRGGIFINHDIEMIEDFNMPFGKKLAVFRNVSSVNSNPWAINPSLIQSSPMNREIKLSIELIKINIKISNDKKIKYYELVSDIIGRSMAIIYSQDEYWCGETIRIIGNKLGSCALISPNGKMIAQQIRPFEESGRA